jgi:predicted nucleic acid-binding protein
MEEFISLADVVEIDKLIIQNCVDLRRNCKIKLPDAIIAATALTRNFILITNNEKDFAQIPSLTVINLYSL